MKKFLQHQAVKVAAMEVKDAIQMFTADDVTEEDLGDYKSKLKDIDTTLEHYNDVVDELVEDLNPDDNTDKERLDRLLYFLTFPPI